MKTSDKLKKVLTDGKLIPIFEIEVIDKRTNQTDYIIFDISVNGDKLTAQHIGLSQKEEESNKIDFCEVTIDEDFSADCNLQELYEECINSIIESEFFTLPNDEEETTND